MADWGNSASALATDNSVPDSVGFVETSPGSGIFTNSDGVVRYVGGGKDAGKIFEVPHDGGSDSPSQQVSAPLPSVQAPVAPANDNWKGAASPLSTATSAAPRSPLSRIIDPLDMMNEIPAMVNTPGATSGIINDLGQGATLGASDEIGSAFGASAKYAGNQLLKSFPETFTGNSTLAPGTQNTVNQSWGDLYDKDLSNTRATMTAADEAAPNLSVAAQIGASVPTGLGLMSKFPAVFGAGESTAPLLHRLTQSAKSAGLLGGIYGFNSGQDGAVSRGVNAAVTGAASAIASPVLGEGLRTGGRVLGLNPFMESYGKTDAQKALANYFESQPDLLDQAPQALSNIAKANSMGVTLTTPEAFDDPGLLASQGVLTRNGGQGASAAQTLRDTRQTQELPTAFNNMVNDISPVGSPDQAGQQLINSADTATVQARQTLSAKAAPYYEKAFYPQADDLTLGTPATIPKNSAALKGTRVKDYVSQVRKDIPELNNHPDNSLPVLNQAKILMDGDIGDAYAGKKGLGTNDARLIKNARTILVNEMDKSSPMYAKARSIYEHGAPEMNSVLQGKIGALANMKDISAPNAPNQLFKMSPTQAQQVAKTLPQKDVRAGVAGYLRNAEGNMKGENYATIPNHIYNTPNQKALFEAYLGKDSSKVDDLMKVMTAVNKGQNALSGSTTEPLMEAKSSLDKLGESIGLRDYGEGFKPVVRITENVAGITPKSQMINKEKFNNDLADVLLSDKGAAFAEMLRKAKPSVDQAQHILDFLRSSGISATPAATNQYTKVNGE